MVRYLKLCIFLLLNGLLLPPAVASIFGQHGNQFVTASQAFAFDFNQQNNRLTLSWQIKPDYYLYRQQLRIVVKDAQLADWKLPEGKPHEDEFYGKTAIYQESLTLPFTLLRAAKGSTVTVTWQGCAAAGFCYPPETRTLPLNEVMGKPQPPATSNAAPHDTTTPTSAAQHDSPTEKLPFSPLWALLIGIGVAFTPCVLPMYPLISGIILGHQHRYSFGRLFALAMSYVQGMALTYTVMGVTVAAAGLRFQAALQSPAVLIGLSLLFILLALSMFGLFSLQLPSSLQTRLALLSNRQREGSLSGVMVMGALAGLICSPCTTAPLSAILLYIAQRGNLLAGAGTLYLYALGMGLPLIAVTLFGHRLLPKSGDWMRTVKEGFGFVILALPVFLMARIVGDLWGLRLWSLLGVAFFGWAFISLKSANGWLRLAQIVMLAAALVAARPLQDWAFATPTRAAKIAHLNFHRISDVGSLNEARQNSNGRITMLDFYADWCVACKEFEQHTFSQPGVQTALKNTQLLQADISRNNAEDHALLERLQVLGLPTILFFDASGREIPQSRVTGFMNSDEFEQHLQKLPH
ncbi:protein-disulfide reductase DsbD [Erwinia psidii]|uniref:Thiol:disulfide interchange protein DsbD n=1 Tax=Erwinia psidii TaxID=69224 RepID=A0A3N6SHA5_9GAMM|nr:protein-disulfide reductase DsbD [Erwinia psidii]MCX8958309.1 protein-disulfide reductase DsbD [Erwinia psidii]MCX8962450.1 protein-disulfide reductase DsbD [Erwinia psidii]MCX8965235.1 protein-disulfide reductase DsbD [Erwinia psidii]RQM38111.1 protein-disulfide reductase DsbD [Erwinia psidii]